MRSATWNPNPRWGSRSSTPGRIALRSLPNHLRIAQNLANARSQPLPGLLFFGELFSAGHRQRIEARLAILLGHAPFRAHPTGLLHTMQRRVERSLFDAQQLVGNGVDVGSDGVAVHGLLA